MKYIQIYNNLIMRAKNRTLDCYTETHRILPGCLGGEYIKANIVELTPEEHYVAHQLLVKIYPGNSKLIYAAKMMTVKSKDHKIRGNKLYGWLRRKLAIALSVDRKGKKNPGRSNWMKQNNPMKTEVCKANMSKRVSGSGNAMFGRKHSKETKQNWSQNRSGIIPKNTKIIVQCPNCFKTGSLPPMKRWHFNNCSQRI